jgi:hypothetical protein
MRRLDARFDVKDSTARHRARDTVRQYRNRTASGSEWLVLLLLVKHFTEKS